MTPPPVFKMVNCRYLLSYVSMHAHWLPVQLQIPFMCKLSESLQASRTFCTDPLWVGFPLSSFLLFYGYSNPPGRASRSGSTYRDILRSFLPSKLNRNMTLVTEGSLLWYYLVHVHILPSVASQRWATGGLAEDGYTDSTTAMDTLRGILWESVYTSLWNIMVAFALLRPWIDRYDKVDLCNM